MQRTTKFDESVQVGKKNQLTLPIVEAKHGWTGKSEQQLAN